MKYSRPKDLPGRVCRALEGYLLESDDFEADKFINMVYRFTHIASGRCEHDGWLKEFYQFEEMVEEAAFTSPKERAEKEKA